MTGITRSFYLSTLFLALLLLLRDFSFNALAVDDRLAMDPGRKKRSWHSSHFLFDELQSTIHSHSGLSLVLFQQHRSNELVYIRFVIKLGEFALHALVLLLLRLELLAGIDQTLELCGTKELETIGDNR